MCLPSRAARSGSTPFRSRLNGGVHLAALVVAPALLTLSGAAQAHTVARSDAVRCPPTHTHVRLRTAQATLYTLSVTGQSVVAGCAREGLRAFRLGFEYTCEGGSEANCEGVNEEALAGTMVAYQEASDFIRGEELLSGGDLVVVRSLQTGRIVHRAPTGSPLVARKGFVGVGAVTAIVVDNAGSVGWIVLNRERSRPSSRYYEVHSIDRWGRHLLASGPSIRQNSLRLHGRVLSWKEAEHRRIVVLR